MNGAASRLGIIAANAVRPVDVLAAARTFRPSYGTLGAADAARAELIIRAALADLDARIVVNRPAAELATVLREGGEFSTAAASNTGAMRDLDRWGIAGAGNLRGHTVFGSVQFFPDVHSAGGGSLEPADNGVGAFGFGSIASVLRPNAAERTTFTSSYYRDQAAGHGHLASSEQLADVVLERLTAEYGFHPGHPLAHDPATDRLLRASFRLMVRDDPDRAVGTVRDFLTGNTLRNRPIEAQVRGVSVADVDQIHVEHFVGDNLTPSSQATDVALVGPPARARHIPIGVTTPGPARPDPWERSMQQIAPGWEPRQ